MVSLVFRGCPPTEDMVVCPSRLALFCLSLLIFSTLHDCMSQQFLRLLCRERKIHPCNLETRSTTEHISREGDCRKSDKYLLSPQPRVHVTRRQSTAAQFVWAALVHQYFSTMFYCYFLRDINNSSSNLSRPAWQASCWQTHLNNFYNLASVFGSQNIFFCMLFSSLVCVHTI